MKANGVLHLPGRWLAWIALVALPVPSAAHSEEDAAARRLLAEKGLMPSNSAWVLPSEVRIRKLIHSLDTLEKRFWHAQHHAEAMLQKNEAIRAELARAEAAKDRGKKPRRPPTVSTGETTSAESQPGNYKPPTELHSQLPDVTGLGDITPLQVAMVDLINARAGLTLALAKILGLAARLDEEYRPLREDPEVIQALQGLGSKGRLGPIRQYDQHPRVLAISERVLTSQVPVFRESGRHCLSVIVDEQTPATFCLGTDKEPTYISASLAQSLGIATDQGSAVEQHHIAGRQIAARTARIASLRIGKHVFRDVPVLLLPSEAEDLGNQLGPEALQGFRTQLDPRGMVLSIEPPGSEAR